MKRGSIGWSADLRAWDADCIVFAAAYFITAALSFNSLTAGSVFVKIIAGLIMIWGTAAVIRRLFMWKYIRKDRLFLLSVFFFASAVLSSLINIRYGFVGSLKMLVWMALELFLMAANVKKEVCGNRIEVAAASGRHGKGALLGDEQGGNAAGLARRVMFSMLFVVTFCQSLISVVMLVIGFSDAAIERGQYIGLQLGRLWGCYSDPNYGSVLACCSIAVSIGELSRRNVEKRRGYGNNTETLYAGNSTIRHQYRTAKNRQVDIISVLLALNVVLQYIYIVFSYSRTGQICLAAVLLLSAYVLSSGSPNRTSLPGKASLSADAERLGKASWSADAERSGKASGSADAVRSGKVSGSSDELWSGKVSQPVKSSSPTDKKSSVGSGGFGKIALWFVVLALIVILAGPVMEWLRAGYNMIESSISFSPENSSFEAQTGEASGGESIEAAAFDSMNNDVISDMHVYRADISNDAEVLSEDRSFVETAGPDVPDIPAATPIFREDIQSGGLTNGRTEIWKEGLLIWKDNPIFGISYRNIALYVRENHPDGYMTTRENELNTFHNLFVDVLVGQGMLGELIALAMTVVIMARAAALFRNDGGEAGSTRLWSCVPAVLVLTIGLSSLALTEILYINTPTAVLFWHCLSLMPAANVAQGQDAFSGHA